MNSSYFLKTEGKAFFILEWNEVIGGEKTELSTRRLYLIF